MVYVTLSMKASFSRFLFQTSIITFSGVWKQNMFNNARQTAQNWFDIAPQIKPVRPEKKKRDPDSCYDYGIVCTLEPLSVDTDNTDADSNCL